MNKKLSFIIVFFCGIAITGLEIASARISAPFFGSTIYVWGGAIGTVLAALSFGYWMGGKIVDRYHRPEVVTWVLLGAGITTEMIPLLFTPVNNYLFQVATKWHSPIGLIVILSMLTLFFIPVVCLGMISPIILRLSLVKIEEVGGWSGLLSSGATFGSIIGTFSSAYWTIPTFGTRLTIIGAGLVLFLLALTTAKIQTKVYLLTIVLTTTSFIQSSMTLFIPRKNVVWAKESPYQYIRVVLQGGERYLLHDAAQATQSTYRPSDPNGPGPYDIFGVLPYLSETEGTHRTVLILGLGGGNMVRTYQRILSPKFTFDIVAVEIDQEVVRAAREMFDLQPGEAKIVSGDARQYVRSIDRKFDIIIVDAYSHEMQIPPMLATQEFFQEIQARLEVGGVLGMNAFVLPGGRYFSKLTATVANVFPDVRDVTFTPNSPNHFIIAGQQIDQQRLPEKLDPVIPIDMGSLVKRMNRVNRGGDVYTDDRTDLDLRVRPFVNNL